MKCQVEFKQKTLDYIFCTSVRDLEFRHKAVQKSAQIQETLPLRCCSSTMTYLSMKYNILSMRRSESEYKYALRERIRPFSSR